MKFVNVSNPERYTVMEILMRFRMRALRRIHHDLDAKKLNVIPSLPSSLLSWPTTSPLRSSAFAHSRALSLGASPHNFAEHQSLNFHSKTHYRKKPMTFLLRHFAASAISLSLRLE